LRIDSVEAFPIRLRAEERLRTGSFSYDFYQTVLVKVDCDGEIGWGEAMTRFEPGATALLVRYFGRSIVGKDLEPSDAYRFIWRQLRSRGHTRGTDVEALSGLEIALQDAFARAKRKPLARLLAPRPKEKVKVYAGSLFESRGALEKQVERVQALGLVGVKVKVGFGTERDCRLLRSVRKLIPEGMLVADANGAYDLRGAEKVAKLFAEFGLAWLEEPLLPDDWAGYEELGRKSRVPIGAGESWFEGDFGPAVERHLVGVLEPSVSRCGGVGTEAAVGRLADKRKLGFSPMTGMNSAVSLAASIHIAASVPSIAVEYNPFPNPLQTELARGLPSPEGGTIRVPDGPGLGLEIDERFVKRHSESR